MTGNVNVMEPGKSLGLAKAWGAYIRMIAASIITKQKKIDEKVDKTNGSGSD